MSVPGPSRAQRTLTTLFVRPAAELALPSLYRFPVPREGAETLPLGLVRLASVVKFGSRHRVAVHDARVEVGGNRALRSVAALFRPDAAVLWLHPAYLADGLEAARAVRQAGCELVVGTGPLVDLWSEGAARIPELDGLLPSCGSEALLRGLDALASSAGSTELLEAFSAPIEARIDLPVDRKLVDYAHYRHGMGAKWPILVPDERWAPTWIRERLGGGERVAAVSPVFLHSENGELLPPEVVLDDLQSCRLLGILTVDLVVRPQCAPPDAQWMAEFLPRLRHEDGAVASPFRLRLAIDPKGISELPLLDLPHLGIEAFDLGDVPAGDEEALDVGLSAARLCRRQRLQPTGTLVLGRPGYSPELELRGLERAVGEGFPTTAGVEIRLGTVDSASWVGWLDAPSPNFRPPGLSDERMALAEQAREALEVAPEGQQGLRATLLRAIRSRT